MVNKIFRPVSMVWGRFWRLPAKKKAAVVVVVAVVSGVAWRQYHKANGGPEYELAVAAYETITEVVSETGNVTSTGATPVYSTTNGVVEEVYVANGDYVDRDVSLFKVVSTASKQEKDAALSAYLTAKSAWETAKATELGLQAAMFGQWDRFKELAEGDEYEDADGNPRLDERNLAEFQVPEKEWLAAEAAYKKQAGVVLQAGVGMSAAWQAYQATQDSEVKAILPGEVRNLGITRGDTVAVWSAVALTKPAPALVLFGADTGILVKLEVGETDAIKVKEGQAATVEFDALPHQEFGGRVDRVDSLAVPAAGVVKYAVYVGLDEAIEGIKGGMTADVEITVASKSNVLTVPASAVKPHEGGRAVRVAGDDGEIGYVPVVTGSRGDGKIEIVSGIGEGTEVIVALKNEQVERAGASLF